MLAPAQLSGPSASAPLLPRRIILLASGPTVSYGTDSSQVCTQASSSTIDLVRKLTTQTCDKTTLFFTCIPTHPPGGISKRRPN
jgi:hypothetical protein